MKKVLISVGPIPARLDSVKFITNRFKGGLAMKTAKYLKDNGFDVTVLKWKFTDTKRLEEEGSYNIVSVIDVFEYCEYVKEHVKEFNAFIMAAAVANLAPSNPYEDKFPSHLYKVGEKFNIEFEIAPRAIDIVKQLNPRCCLIGYKLFDAKTDEELIEIAKHTLNDSKANIIFANTPSDAANRKIALFQDNTHFECDFNKHMELIAQAINEEYFKTVVDATVYDDLDATTINKINMCKQIVKNFEESLPDKYGTIAIKVSSKNDFVTTSRGHKGEPVYVKEVDIDDKIVVAEAKATLNAPALYAFMQKGFDYVVHKHDTQKSVEYSFDSYVAPGTIEEFRRVQNALLEGYSSIMEFGHGYLDGKNVLELDWDKYYDIFEDRYMNFPDAIKRLIDNTDTEEWLDVGCNKYTRAKYVLDKFVELKGKENLKYDQDHKEQFSLITLKNSLNYLSNKEIETLQSWLSYDGILIANSFANTPDFRFKDNEAVYLDTTTNMVQHFIIGGDGEVYHHEFKATDIDRLKSLGFEIEYVNNGKTVIARYHRWKH